MKALSGPTYLRNPNSQRQWEGMKDYGAEPFVVDIEEATQQNRISTALWTGNHLQLTLMSIGVGDDIGLEMHPDVDQFIRVEQGEELFLWRQHGEFYPTGKTFQMMMPY